MWSQLGYGYGHTPHVQYCHQKKNKHSMASNLIKDTSNLALSEDGLGNAQNSEGWPANAIPSNPFFFF